jgi:formate hydrogenlyase subunit 6/NADH:ubiquinone oxidoreductase subunit I
MCQKKCPTGAITMFKEEKKFTVKRQNCIVCGYCVEVCPKKCIYMDAAYSKPFRAKGEDTFL